MTQVTFDAYTSSSRGTRFTVPEEKWVTYRPLTEDQRIFDRARYATEVHPPVILFPSGEALHREYRRCLDLPIRLRGEEAYAVPEEWAGLAPLIQHIAELEHGSNPSVIEDYYTYLTVDSSWVKKGQQQRNGGVHVDGFQGARIKPKTKITRSYTASSNGGTIFYPQTFDLNLDDEKYNLFLAMEEQAGEPLSGPAHSVVFMDAYTVHESGRATQDGLRTFVRVTYDMKKFDRLGNSHNSMLAYEWDMIERNVHSTLAPPPGKRQA